MDQPQSPDTPPPRPSRRVRFLEPTDGNRLLAWWASFDATQGERRSRGDRAELRRVEEPLQAMFVPAFHDLRYELQIPSDDPDALARLARVALVVVHVREHVAGAPVAAQLGRSRGEGGPPVFSESRMRRLLTTANPDDAAAQLRRAVQQLGESCNLLDLADATWWWSARTRQQWAIQYYEALGR